MEQLDAKGLSGGGAVSRRFGTDRKTIGRMVIAAVAVSSIVVPVGVDGFLWTSAHMANPAWLPHAKLHTAMSFFSAAALGLGALALLAAVPRAGRAVSGIAAFLASAFWASLILARLWPGTCYAFCGDPALGDLRPPVVLGVPVEPNVAMAALLVVAGAVGFFLAGGQGSPRTARTAPRVDGPPTDRAAEGRPRAETGVSRRKERTG